MLVNNVERDENGRYLILYVTVNNHKMLMCNVYAPNEEDLEFFENLFERISHYNPEFYCIGGDFNAPLEVNIDKLRGAGQTHPKRVEKIIAFLDNNDLIDLWRETYPEKAGYTWRRIRPKPVFVRLDYFFISSSMSQLIGNMVTNPGFRSDHSIVQFQLNFDLPNRGPGYWKFNNSLLLDRDYLERINSLIDINLAQNFKNKKQQWELLKIEICGSTLQYTANKAKSRVNKLSALQKKLKNIEKEQETVNIDILRNKEEQAVRVRTEIDEIMKEKTRSAILRTRSNWQLLGEHPTRYFLGLEKCNFHSKTIY